MFEKIEYGGTYKCGNAGLLRSLQRVGVPLVADDERDVSAHALRGVPRRVDQRLQVAAVAGRQHCHLSHTPQLLNTSLSISVSLSHTLFISFLSLSISYFLSNSSKRIQNEY